MTKLLQVSTKTTKRQSYSKKKEVATTNQKMRIKGQYNYKSQYMRAVHKVRGLNLLLPVGTLQRCGNSLFFKVPPLASDALLTTLHPLLENMLQTIDYFEISCLGGPSSRLEKPRNCMG
jgi:hypothetical protein